MQQSINNIKFLTGSAGLLESVSNVPVLPAWSEKAVDFLSAFSQNLLGDPRSHNFADIVSYAFWIRKASLKQIKDHYYPYVESKVGRGVAFHITPSNVPINFAVSFTSSLLAGNVNIVRISNKQFEQVDIILDALKKAFSDGKKDMEGYLILIRYEHNAEITKYLSSICDIRIIWGGDRTINIVREALLLPRAIEMTFADRHSLALIDAEAVLKTDMAILVDNFYTDTYYIDQNACSSPRLIIWFGKNIEEAKYKFWNAVEKLAIKKYDMKPIQAVDKFEQFCCLAASKDGIHLVNHNNRVMRIKVDKLDAGLLEYKFGGGYFFEYAAKDIEEIIPVIDKQCQTIAYYGLEPNTVQQFIINSGVRGVDRVVPIGKTMDLTFKWDGYDMIETMSRYIYCPNYMQSKGREL